MTATNPNAVPADVYAARKIAAALNTGPPISVRAIADDSGLTEREVAELVDRLRAKRGVFHPTKPAAGHPDPVPVPSGRNDPTLPAAWLSHDNPRVRRLAEKARKAIDATAQAVADDSGRAQLRAKREELRAQLAAVDAELRGSTGSVPCPHCTRTFANARAVQVHTARSHKAER